MTPVTPSGDGGEQGALAAPGSGGVTEDASCFLFEGRTSYLSDQGAQMERGEGRLLGRLHHDGVPAAERGRQLPRQHQEREVPLQRSTEERGGPGRTPALHGLDLGRRGCPGRVGWSKLLSRRHFRSVFWETLTVILGKDNDNPPGGAHALGRLKALRSPAGTKSASPKLTGYI